MMKITMNRILSLALCLCMVLGLLPAVGLTAKAAEPVYYIASIAVSYGKKESTPKDILRGQGYTVMDYDLNEEVGGMYIYMGYKTTTDPTKAITGIAFRYGENPPNSASYNGSTFYLLGGSTEPNPGENVPVDLNEDADGEYIYTYVTRDANYSSPITAVCFNGSVYGSVYELRPGSGGWNRNSAPEIGSGENANLNQGSGMFIDVYEYHFKTYITSTVWQLDSSNHVRNEFTYGGYVTSDQQMLYYTVHPIGKQVYIDNYTYLVTLRGWREDDTAAAPAITSNPGITYYTQDKVFRAIYSADLTLSYNANGGTGAPATQTVMQYLNAGTTALTKQTVSATVSSGVPTHPNKCKFLGWSTSSSATSPSYTGGNSISMSGNVTLYAVYQESHTPGADDGDCTTPIKCTACGTVTTAAKAHTPAADDGDCTTPIKCTACGTVTTAAKAHTPAPDDLDCTTPIKCTTCGTVTTEAKAHNWSAATCTTPKTCTACGTTEGEALGHANFDENGFCTVCGAYRGCELNEYGHYEIRNVGQLMWFAELVNGGDRNANAVLAADIDLGGREWTPIASTGLYYNTTTYPDKGYTGTFDGQGHVISNMHITTSATVEQTYGLFGTLSGTVKNLGMSNVSYTFPNGAKDMRSGGIVGQMLDASRVENCYVVDSAITPGQYIAGGVAACNYAGTIENCFTYNVAISANVRCGNLVSDIRGDINENDRPGAVINCYTDAAWVTGSQKSESKPLVNCQDGVAASRFASGEIAYLLGGAFGQSIGTDELPVFGGQKVYGGYKTCADTEMVYTNDESISQTRIDHSWNDATCELPKTCSACGTTEGEALGHKWDNATCMTPKTCSACGVTEGEPLDYHPYDESTLLCVCGAISPDAVALVSMDGTATAAYTELSLAIEAVRYCAEDDKAEVKLLKNIDLGTSSLYINGNGVFTLDLNDCTITSTATFNVFNISTGITVTVIDSGEEGIGGVQHNGGTWKRAFNVGGTLNLEDGTFSAIYVSNEGIVNISGEAEIIGADYGVDVYGGTAYIKGGTISNTSLLGYGAIYVYEGQAIITGGTISGAENDIAFNTEGVGSVILTLEEGSTTGATFPDGVTVKKTTIGAVLGEGMTYWAGNTMLSVDGSATQITGKGDITAKAICDHSDNKNADDNDCTTALVCSECATIVAEAQAVHSFDDSGKCINCEANVSSVLTIQMTDKYGDGWSDNAIEVYEDGQLIATVTIEERVASGTRMFAYDAEKIYTFKWVQGRYANECSFEILFGTKTVFAASNDDCSGFANGQTVFTTCDHAGNTNEDDGDCTTAFCCSYCGWTLVQAEPNHTPGDDLTSDELTHSFSCAICGTAVEGAHSFVDKVCICGLTEEDVVAVTVINGVVKGYSNLEDALDAVEYTTAEDAAVVKLVKNIDLGESYLYISRGAFTLDLNDCTVTSSNSSSTFYISMYNGGSMTVVDNGETGIGSIENTGAFNHAFSINRGTLNLESGTCGTVYVSSGAILNISGEAEIIADDYAVRLYGGTANIKGGTISNTSTTSWYAAIYVDKGQAVITGGEIKGKVNDISFTTDATGTVTLTLEEGSTTGATFPDGITVYRGTLNAVLGEGMTYWAGNTMLSVDSSATQITGKGDITVKAICDHSGNKNVDDNNCTTALVCSECAAILVEAQAVHSFDDSGKCINCEANVSSVLAIQMTDKYGDSWNGNAIEVYEDGQLIATVTIEESVASSTRMFDYDAEKIYTFKWVQGRYASECSFEILFGTETVFTASNDDCSGFANGQTVFTTCNHAGNTNEDDGDCTTAFCCSYCGWALVQAKPNHTPGDDLACDELTHSFSCAICGTAVEEAHSFVNKVCICGLTEEDVVAVTVINGVVKGYSNLEDALEAVEYSTAEDEAVVKLVKNIDLGDDLVFINGGTFTLDLNDCTVTSSYFSGTFYMSMYNGGSMTVVDNGETGIGSIENTGTVKRAFYHYKGNLNLESGTCGTVYVGNDAILNISGEAEIIGDNYGIQVYGGTVNIKGGTISSTSMSSWYGAIYVDEGQVIITGGTISGAGSDIAFNTEGVGSVILTLEEGSTTGATFPDGITVCETTLNAILGEGAAYWQSEKQLHPADSATAISGDVVVKAVCTHENTSVSYEPNGEKHLVVYSCCGLSFEEDHSYDDGVTTEPTCTETGYTTHTCALCGKSYVDDFTLALGHTPGEDDVCTVCGADCSGMRIYFLNEQDWDKVLLYYWKDRFGLDVDWPGIPMELYGNDGTHDIYVLEVPNDIIGIIINNGATMTPDLTDFYDGVCYYPDGSSKNISEILPLGWTQIDGQWFYVDPESGEKVTGMSRVPYPTEEISGITYAPDQEAIDYYAGKNETFIDETEGWFLFDENGVFQSDFNGMLETDDKNIYVENGFAVWNPGLVELEDGYYYFIGDEENGGNMAAVGNYYVGKNNTDLNITISGLYTFDENGKLCEYDGIVDIDGTLYYYEDYQLMQGKGLIATGGSFYYVRSDGSLVVGQKYWVANNNGYKVDVGEYEFDEDGKLIFPEKDEKHGIYFERGGWYYYENGKKAYSKGLISTTLHWYDADGNDVWGEGGIVYVRSDGRLATGKYYISNIDNFDGAIDVKVGMALNFNDMGLYIAPKTGIYEDADGILRYYINDVMQYNSGVIVIDDNYYYVRSNGVVVSNCTYWITNVGSSGVVAGEYVFDENGVMQDPEFAGEAVLNGIANGYYYEDGKIAYNKGLTYLEAEGCYIYVRSNGMIALGKYWITNHHDLLPAGMYDFGTDGKLYR